MADKHGKTAAQAILRWVLQQEIIDILKSENPGRMRENAFIFDFELDEEHLSVMAQLDRGQKGNTGIWNPWDYKK